MKRTMVIGVLVLALATVFVLYGSRNSASAPVVGDDTATPDTGLVYTNATSDDITVNAPRPHDEVSGVFVVSGSARGNWYFEASFPIEVVAENGLTLAQFPVQAQGEWMTTDFVPFSEEVSLGSYTGNATVILHKDNPSGLPEHDASVSIPIVVRQGTVVPAVSSTTTPTAGSDGLAD